MENAGQAAYFTILKEFGIRNKNFVCFCGVGNNGGDGLVVARKIYSNGGKVTVFILGDQSKFQGAAKQNFDIVNKIQIELLDLQNVSSALETINRSDAVIDAIFGTGLDREVKGLFDLLDEITKKIIISLQVKLTQGEQARFYTRGTNNLEAYLKVIKGLDLVLRFNKDDTYFGRQLFKEAIALDPNYAGAYTLLGYTHRNAAMFGWTKNPRKSIDLAFKLAQKALSLDENDANTHLLLSAIYNNPLRMYKKAEIAGRKAIAIEPNSADVNATFAAVLSNLGKHEEAIAMIEKAIKLNPVTPGWCLWIQGNIYDSSGQSEKAIKQYEKAIQHLPQNTILIHQLVIIYIRAGQFEKSIELIKIAFHLFPKGKWLLLSLVVSYMLLGQEKEARFTVKKILELYPRFSLDQEAITKWQWKNQSDLDRYIAALQKAGLK